jgi:hypothetical protein
LKMLVRTCKSGQGLVMTGPQGRIVVRVLRERGGRMRLAATAPADVAIATTEAIEEEEAVARAEDTIAGRTFTERMRNVGKEVPRGLRELAEACRRIADPQKVIDRLVKQAVDAEFERRLGDELFHHGRRS